VTTKFCILALFAATFSIPCLCQYILNGSAYKNNCNCYTLTTEKITQSGSVWNSTKIDLNNSFDFHFNVYLGCKDGDGADGIVFMLQPISTSVGTTGEGLGFEGVSPSVGISLDTWQNFPRNDPYYDHISIQLNGNVTHGNDLAGPIPASASSDNIEDCKWHVLRIVWDVTTKTLSTYFDGVFRLQAQYDLVKDVFNNNPMVYWGFSGATGGADNLQQFCTALNPDFTTNFPNNTTCFGPPVIFTDHSESFTVIQKYFWDFGDGTTSTEENPAPHKYPSPGAYIVKHVITGKDGCVSDTLKKTIYLGAKPVADFSLFDTCSQKTIGVSDHSQSNFGKISKWDWVLDGTTHSSDSLPAYFNLSLGRHDLSLAATTIYGCSSDTAKRVFNVMPTPVVRIEAQDGCWKLPINFSARQVDNATNIIRWNWKFGDGLSSSQKDPEHTYTTGGMKTIHLIGIADNGCASNDTSAQIHVESIFTNAGKDTSVQADKPFSLDGTWSGDVVGAPALKWSPSTGLSTTSDANPVANLQNDQTYSFTAVTDIGCTATDQVRISVFKFPGVLVPTAFTPNHDGLNEILRPRYNGIKHLDYFTIYNRWGQLVFRTSEMDKGWNGTFEGKDQATGVFVWVISAEGFDGRRYQLRGTTAIIR